jgi:hypothetical protein
MSDRQMERKIESPIDAKVVACRVKKRDWREAVVTPLNRLSDCVWYLATKVIPLPPPSSPLLLHCITSLSFYPSHPASRLIFGISSALLQITPSALFSRTLHLTLSPVITLDT